MQAGKSGIKSMTISRRIIDKNEVVDLWRLESNDFDEWEYGSIPIPSIKDSFEVRNIKYLFSKLETLICGFFFSQVKNCAHQLRG